MLSIYLYNPLYLFIVLLNILYKLYIYSILKDLSITSNTDLKSNFNISQSIRCVIIDVDKNSSKSPNILSILLLQAVSFLIISKDKLLFCITCLYITELLTNILFVATFLE